MLALLVSILVFHFRFNMPTGVRICSLSLVISNSSVLLLKCEIMKNLIKLTGLGLILILVSFQSCKKDEAKSETEILTSTKWKWTSITVNGTEVIDDCQKDDIFIFATDSTYTVDPGKIRCDPDDKTRTDTWYLSDNGKSLFLFGSLCSIVAVTEKKLVVRWVIDPSYTIVETFIPW